VLPLTICILLIAAVAAKKRKSSPFWTSFTMICYICLLGYFLFKMVRMYTADDERQNQYLPARPTLTAFAVISLVLLVVTVSVAARLYVLSRRERKEMPPTSSDSKVATPTEMGTIGLQRSNTGRLVID